MLRIIFVLILVSCLYISIRLYEDYLTFGPEGRIFADNDGSMRWLLVLKTLNGEDFRIRWINEDNAPFGRINEWTSPSTILGAFSTILFNKLAGWSLKDAWGHTGVWMGVWMGLVIMAITSLYAWCYGGGWRLALAWLITWQPLADFIQMTRLGNPDYHSLHQLLLLVMFLSTYRAVAYLRNDGWKRKEATIHAVLVGLAASISIWSSATECLILVILVYGLGFYEFWLDPIVKFFQHKLYYRKNNNCNFIKVTKKKKLQITGFLEQKNVTTYLPWSPPHEDVKYFWLVSLRVFATTLLTWHLFEYWPEIWTSQLEMLSPLHVAAAFFALICFELRCRSSTWLGAIVPVIVSAIVLIFLAGWIREWKWHNLHIIQSELYWKIWSVTFEMQGWWHGFNPLNSLLKRLWYCYGLIIPAFVLTFWALIKRKKAGIWAVTSTVTIFYLSLFQARWGYFFVVLIVLVAVLSMFEAFSKHRSWLAFIFVTLTLPCWSNVYSSIIKSQAVSGAYLESALMQMTSSIVTRDFGKKGAVVLAPWHLTPRMICHGQVRTLGSAYWSNLEGIKVTYEIYSTWSEEKLRRLLAEREVDYFLARSPSDMQREVYEATTALTGGRISQDLINNAAIIKCLANKADFLVPLKDIPFNGWTIYRIDRTKL